MPARIKVHEHGRDEDFGILRKEVQFPSSLPIRTPTRCVKNPSPRILQESYINEVIKKVFPRTIESIWDGTDRPTKSVKSRFLPNKLNFAIFDLVLDKIPDREKLRSLTSYWYAASQSVLFLPTVASSLLKDGKRLSEKKVDDYVDMMRYIIETTEAIGNSKAFIGTIPLLPSKYSSSIVKLYLDKGFNAFAIDASTKDFLYHEPEFRSILAQINEQIPLSQAFIYACNLGIPQFEKYKARADDFLSLFAYVDAFGGTFKTRGGPGFSVGKPRVKKFLRSELCYEHLYGEKDRMNDFNQCEQVIETNLVRPLIGHEKMQKYLATKNAVDPSALKRLGSIAKEVKAI
ncbi:hypothetical protein MUP77_00265 [Candidatus Bathyarchaeota archaeon]|nr:hypothetical protein [Candidatus Bathyarchaeota archaeon]